VTQLNDLDFGPSHSWLRTRVGQVLGQAQVEGLEAVPWARGRTLEEQPVDLYVAPWQGLGGNPAMTRASLLLLLRQLEELAGNADMQPLYIGWSSTAFPSAPLNVAEAHDGWYIVTLAQPPYRRYVVTGGVVTVPVSVAQVAPASPAAMALGYRGTALASTFSGDSIYSNGPTPLLGLPIGATLPSQGPGSSWTRAGAEGSVPVVALQPAAAGALPTIQPVRFVRPGTVAALFTGGVRVFDTMAVGGNAVPTNGTAFNSSWVQVYGRKHDFQGDCIVTNGLLLLLFSVGQTGAPRLYVWNTSLSPPAWAQVFDLNYFDNAVSGGTLREVTLERVGLLWSQWRVLLSTANANYAQLRFRLAAGSYAATVEFTPLTQSVTSNLALLLNLANSAKIIFDDSGVQDLSTTSGGVVTTSSTLGYGAAFGTQANGPIYGFVYQNGPSTGQPVGNGVANIGLGDPSGPALNAYRTYGIFAVPYGSNGASSEKLQGEGEGGTLGTGWSSVADAAASGGNTAKAASGTAAGNADLFGTAFVPAPGVYDAWFRVRVTSAAGSAAEMTLGLWDATAGAFVAAGSGTFAANQAATGYGWLRVTNAAGVLPTAGHQVRWRAVTALALGTDWFIDEAVVLPHANGIGSAAIHPDFPGDLWAQWAFEVRARPVVG